MHLRPQINIQKIEEIGQASSIITDLDERSLILINELSSLMMPIDPYFRQDALEHFAFIYKNRTQNLSVNDVDILHHLRIMESPSRLVDCHIHALLKYFDQKQALVLAYTGMRFGKIGHTFFPDYVLSELSYLGINLSNVSTHRNITNTTMHFGRQAGIDKGIIYTGSGQAKGDYIDEILDVVGFIPNQIVVIDQDEENLKAFGKVVTRHYGIPILGILYNRPSIGNHAQLDKEIFNKKLNKILSKIHGLSALSGQMTQPHHALDSYMRNA